MVEEASITQREHFDEKIDALERYLNGRFQDIERHLSSKIDTVAATSATANQVAKEAVTKAEAAVERRLEGLNELRSLVGDYQRTLLPRAEADVRIRGIETRVDKLEKVSDTVAGRSTGLAAGWAYMIAAVGLIGGIAGIVIAVWGRG